MNSRYVIEKEIKFCCAHRLLGHEGHCKNLHGHNYRVIVRIEAEKLDDVGRVVDFSVVKEEVKGWIDKNWDHAFIFNTNDPIANKIVQTCLEMKHYHMPTNPTAENMAKYLMDVFSGFSIKEMSKKPKYQITKITVYETDDACASVERPFIC